MKDPLYVNFKSLVDSISPLVILDPELNIHFVNQTFKKEFRLVKKKLIGKKFFEVLPIPIEQQNDFIKNVSLSKRKKIQNCEFKIKTRTFGYSIFHFSNEYGIILKDITRIKSMQKEIDSLHSRLLSLQEKERQILARELHDGVGQTILAAKLNFSFFETDSVHYKKNFDRGMTLIDIASQELREIYTNLYPSTLSELGLESAIRTFNKDFLELGNRKVHLNLKIQYRLSDDMQINIYRIVQEISTNIVKHAEADKVSIDLHTSHDFFYISIEDNGKGFDEREITKRHNKGFGLQNIRRRVEDLKGSLLIYSIIGQGTKFYIKIPLR